MQRPTKATTINKSIEITTTSGATKQQQLLPQKWYTFEIATSYKKQQKYKFLCYRNNYNNNNNFCLLNIRLAIN